MTNAYVRVTMNNRDVPDGTASSGTHTAAAATFVERAKSRFKGEIEQLYLFGSTVRGETRGLASDVDVLVVLSDTANREATSESLRDLAYDVMLEFGPVVELHILTAAEFAQSQKQGNPFIRTVVQEGQPYA